MVPLIRGAVLTGYVEIARSVGLDPYRMIADCGLPSACLTDAEVKVPAIAVGRLLESSARESGKADFGLRLAERRTVSNLGAIALLVREQPTIRKALEVMVGYMFLHSEALRLRMEERDGLATLELAIDVGRPVRIRQGVELGVGFLHHSLAQLFRGYWKPQAICFTHARLARQDAHRRFFGTRVQFNQDFNGIVCRSQDIDAAVPAADAAMARHVQRYLDTLASRRDSTMTARVRECIYVMLASGLCSADHVADRLGVDRRTVHRHLAREGETFSALTNAVRVELVTRYIDNRERSLTVLAELLGFSALSAFSRWFRSQYGCSVSDWRAVNLPRSSTAARAAAQ